MQANGQNGTSQGNHALQDYQMQLMLLEQQNKKRLLMARQEQDNVNHVPVNTPGGQSTTFTQNMSPSGSRAGPSPNPNDQIRKIAGTPKMGQNLPGSPAMQGDMQNRATPPGNGYHEMPGVLQHQQRMFSNQGNPMMPGQGGPSSNPGFNNMQMPSGPMNPQQMEQLRLNGGRMPNGQPWQANAQQMMQQGPQGQGTPQQRHSTMPPPPAPNNQEQQRTQPSSPAQTAAPPTPNQTNKANPKGKKEGATKKVRLHSSMYSSALTNIPANSSLRKLRRRKAQPPQRQPRATILPQRRRRRPRSHPCISRHSIRMANQTGSRHKLLLSLHRARITWMPRSQTLLARIR